jgi:2-dehydro-3-deoxyphosphogluconate aldolase/(4S)-4-hydroxy-2-oxoglutarate aldolase
MSDQRRLTGRNATLAAIEGAGIVAVIRADKADQLIDTCKALRDGGVVVMELTMTTPGALGVIEKASAALGDTCIVGAGSILDSETARAAILAGARYLVSPILNLGVIETAHRYDRVVVPGALTPTEVMKAWEAGADMVKVFPANHFGPRYFRDLLAPMPQLKLTPTGGVDLNTAADWLEAGAACLGVGSSLVAKDLMASEDWAGLSDRARQFVEIVERVRG